jgi:hypothetical protein
VAAARGTAAPVSDAVLPSPPPASDDAKRSQLIADYAALWTDRLRLVRQQKLGGRKPLQLEQVPTEELEMLVSDMRQEVRAAQA